jgi:hypothetical protein
MDQRRNTARNQQGSHQHERVNFHKSMILFRTRRMYLLGAENAGSGRLLRANEICYCAASVVVADGVMGFRISPR